MPVRIAVPRESAAQERRVSLVPEVVQKLVKGGATVAVEAGAGEGAFYPDAAYQAAGAEIVADHAALLKSADLLTGVQPPSVADLALLRPKTVVVSLLNPSRNLDGVAAMKAAGVTGFALELVPRITRAQVMDVLSSQATAAGYYSAVLGAELSPKFLPMLTTAAGTIRPAKVLILGAGVAGLMAIATAGEQVRSLGAKFLELAINAEGAGGYARELTPEEKAKEQEMVAKAVAEADVVITTAAIPGRPSPRLIAATTVERMRPGSVIIDLAAEGGGNCELTKAGTTIVAHGVTIVGPLNLPSRLSFHASQMYSKNVQAFLGLLIGANGVLGTDYSDEILAQSLLVSDGEVRHAPTKALLEARQ
jgi:proton-translocating NAD(P)+ transhydrogenase subunit alpha